MMPTRNARRQRWCSSRRGGRTGRAGVDAGGGTPRGNRANICGRWCSHLSWARPDCVAGHVRFELRNVVANYPFESSRGFPRSAPNFGHGDFSRLSCSAGDTQLGAGFCRDLQQVLLQGRWPSFGVAEKARIGRDLFRSEDDRPAAKPATPLLSLRWTFRAKRACVVITDAEPDRLAPLTPPAPRGLRLPAVACVGSWSTGVPVAPQDRGRG